MDNKIKQKLKETKQQFESDPSLLLNEYGYSLKGEIIEGLKSCSNINEESGLLYRVVLWKLNREIFVEKSVIEQLKDFASISKEDKNFYNEFNDGGRVYNLLKMLLESKGIRLPMASTIANFYNPNSFPIIDQRAYRALMLLDYKESKTPQESINVYKKYCKQLNTYYEGLKEKIDYSKMDAFLYMVDKKVGNKANGY